MRGATALVAALVALYNKFQSTLPVRGATKIAFGEYPYFEISIHAPRAGSDSEDAQNGTVYFEQLS